MRIVLSIAAVLLLSLSSCIEAFITQMHIFSSTNGELIYLLGDVHTQNQTDCHQLLWLLTALSAREQEIPESNLEKIDIFIESFYDQQQSSPTVLSHLSTGCQEWKLRSAQCKNAEIRINGRAASWLLSPDEDPSRFTNFEYSLDDNTVNLKTLTYEDLLDELNKNYAIIQAQQDEEHFSEQEIFDHYIKRMYLKRGKLLDELKLREIDSCETIFDSSLRLFNANIPQCIYERKTFIGGKLFGGVTKSNWRSLESNRHKLQKFVLEMYDPIFELSILQKLLSSTTGMKFVIAGGYHIESLKKLLERKGFQLKSSKVNDIIEPIDFRDFQAIISPPAS